MKHLDAPLAQYIMFNAVIHLQSEVITDKNFLIIISYIFKVNL